MNGWANLCRWSVVCSWWLASKRQAAAGRDEREQRTRNCRYLLSRQVFASHHAALALSWYGSSCACTGRLGGPFKARRYRYPCPRRVQRRVVTNRLLCSVRQPIQAAEQFLGRASV